MPMKELLETADVFADPMLLLSVDGTIEASNRPFAEQFGLPAEKLAGKRLDTLAALSASAIEEYLQACAHSDRALAGSLVFRRRTKAIPYRARGVAYPPQSAPSATRVLVCLQAMREAERTTSRQPIVHLDAHPRTGDRGGMTCNLDLLVRKPAGVLQGSQRGDNTLDLMAVRFSGRR